MFQQWSTEDQDVVNAALTAAQLNDIADRTLDSLYGGQRQRAWIAMAIAQDTQLFLLDEPTSALDLGHQIEAFELIQQLARTGKTIVMVVHDLFSGCRYAENMVVMKAGADLCRGCFLQGYNYAARPRIVWSKLQPAI